MDKIFLLTGKPRIGKSTAIKSIAKHLGVDKCGGFYTEEIRNAVDREGFRCITLTGESDVMASVHSNSSMRIGRYGVDIDKFENIALRAVSESLLSKKITVIDEIGFMQMLSVPFQHMIKEAFSSNQYVILGTVCLDNHPTIDSLKELPSIKMYHMTEENRDIISKRVVCDVIKAIN